MKKIILAMVVLISQLSLANALESDTPNRIHLVNTSTSTLDQERNQLMVTVSYPMEQLSGVCAIDIVTDSYNRHNKIEKLLEKVEIKKLMSDDSSKIEVVSATLIRVNLVESSYLDGFKVRTKNGTTLKQAISESLGKNRKVVIFPRSCK